MIDLQAQELTVRIDARSGGLAGAVQTGPDHGPLGHPNLILLVHGYNNDLEDARGSYSQFLRNLQTQWQDARLIMPDVFRFYWPGDKSWGPFSFASYSLEIEPAKKSAKLLAQFVANLSGAGGGLIHLYLIAHSLGSRLVIELLRALTVALSPQVKLEGVCLMAAALPVSKVEAGGELHEASLLTRTVILYSPGDSVLHFGFPLGETLAGDAFWPEAVGRHGQPLAQWSYSKLMMYSSTIKYGHHDYWKKGETAQPIAQFLDPAMPKDLPEAELPMHLTPIPNLISTTDVVLRSLPVRQSFV